jgi:hypothetical protein
MEERMIKRTRIWAWFVVLVLLLTPLAGCGDDDGSEGIRAETAAKGKNEKPIDGSFVGEVSRTKAFIAVVALPAERKEATRGVQVFLTDGRRLSEWFSGTIRDNSFVAKSADGDAEAKGDLSKDSATGSVELADGKKVRYKANRPGGATGFYDLTISAKGKLRGASAAGLGVKGEITLGSGTGMLRLADGGRVKFDLSESAAADGVPLRGGRVRLIVLADGQVRGVGKSRPAQEGRAFFIRSA